MATSQNELARSCDGTKRKKLSYLEAREYATIEQRVEEAEELVKAKRLQNLKIPPMRPMLRVL